VSAPSPTSPLDPAVLTRLAGLKVRVERVVEGVLSGWHRSSRLGVSVDFVEHKEYSPGDDPRHLDWKVLARRDRYAIRKYQDETDLQAMLLVDASGSMGYASAAFSKFDYGSVLAASLATLLVRQGDAAGLIVSGGNRPVHTAPGYGREHIREIIAALEQTRPCGPTCVHASIAAHMESAKRRGMLVVFSDLFDLNADLIAGLRMVAARRHEVAVFHLLDADELSFPFEDPALFASMEDERSIVAFPREVRRAYLEELNAFLSHTRRALVESAVAYQLVSTHEPPHVPLIRYLSARQNHHPPC
jgi:uncharacterized protein (DUF58 family)